MEFKKLKKITSILLAVILVFGIAATGFAASPEDVVVEEVTAEAVAQAVAEEPVAPAVEEPAATVQAVDADLHVTVKDTAGAAIDGATVTVTEGANPAATATTNASGLATIPFASLSAFGDTATWTITATKAGFNQVGTLTVVPSGASGTTYTFAGTNAGGATGSLVLNSNPVVSVKATAAGTGAPNVQIEDTTTTTPFLAPHTVTTDNNGVSKFVAAAPGTIGTVSFEAQGGNYLTGFYLDTKVTTTLGASDIEVPIALRVAPTPTQISIAGLTNKSTANTTTSQLLFSAKASSNVTEDIEYIYQWQYRTNGLGAWTTFDEDVQPVGTASEISGTAGAGTFATGNQYRVLIQPVLGTQNTFMATRPFQTSSIVSLNTVTGHTIKGTISDGIVGVDGMIVNAYDKAAYEAGNKDHPIATSAASDPTFTLSNVPNGTYIVVAEDKTTAPAFKGSSKEIVVNFPETTPPTPQTISGVVLSATAADAIKVTEQPENVVVQGATTTATFTVNAERTDLGTTYNAQLQVSTDSGKTFTDVGAAATGINSATAHTFTVNAITAAMNGNMYRVKLTGPGTAFTTYSDAAILRVRAFVPMTSAAIPASLSSVAGEELKIPATVRGTVDAATFTWYVKTDATANWGAVPSNANYTVDPATGSLTIAAGTVQSTWAGYQFKLVAKNTTPNTTPAVVNTVESNVATLAIVPATPISIKTDVKDVDGIIGRPAVFSVELAGTAPYMVAWQYTTDAGATWQPGTLANTSSTTAVNTFAVPGNLTVSSAGKVQARARIQNAAGTQTIWTALGTVKTVSNPAVLGFATNPASQNVVAGRGFELNATASGSAPFYYVWQTKKVGETAWTTIPATTWSAESKLEITTPATISNSGIQYRTLVTSDTGTAIPTVDAVTATTAIAASTPATITVVPFEVLSIKTQPADVKAAADATAKFSVEAAGSAPYTYLWMVSKDKGATYTEISDSNVATYETAKLTADMEGWMYKVVVSNEEGDEVTSSAATLSVISSIRITGPTSVYPGEKLQLHAALTPEASTANVVWSIAAVNADKASVDQNGLVTAKDNGILNVTATVEGTDIKASYKIRISDKLYVNGGGERPWFTQLPIGPTATVKTSSNAITVDDRNIVKVNRRARNGQRVTVTATYPNTRTTTWSFTLVVVK